MKAILATFLVDAVGLRCRVLIADWSSLYAPTRSAVGFGLERLPGRRLFRGGNVVGFTPGAQAAPGSDSVDRLGPPPPSTVFVGVPAQRMELGAKGRGGPPLGKARLAWVRTVTCDADHVTFCEISVSCLGQTFKDL